MSDLVVHSGGGDVLAMISRAATDPTVDIAKLQALLAFKREVEADEAKKQYTAAMALFKSKAVKIVKNQTVKQGPLAGTRYPDLFAVVDAVTPALSECGLSASWRVTKDERDWIEVTCTITHIAGHSESQPQGGPPDTGGAKNAIQARASTVSYLQRYTLLGALGMTAGGIDNDGGKTEPADDGVDPWTEEMKLAAQAAAEDGKATFAAWFRKLPEATRSAVRGTTTYADFYAKAHEAGK